MSKYRKSLPQLGSQLFLTDGGLETTLIFHNGMELPHFASFDLLRTADGRATLHDYFLPYIETARKAGLGFVLESPTWRANPEWAAKMGYSREALAAVNREAIDLMAELRATFETPEMPMVISGNIGPRGDGYVAGAEMSPEAAAEYHDDQVKVFADSDADMVAAFTMTNVNEALGVVMAAQRHRDAGGDFVHGRDRRPAAERPQSRGGNSSGRRGDRQWARVLHDQLRAPDALRRRCSRATEIGPTGFAASAPMPPSAAMPSSTRLPILTHGDPVELGGQYRDLLRALPADARARRLLRHRPSPRRAHLRVLHGRHGGCSMSR